MHIVLATPLYPPDIAPPAPYIKELATRLSKEHSVTIVTYGRLPEKVPGVMIVAIDKRRPLWWRLLSFTRALQRAAKNADSIYAENGASVELPVAIVSRLTRRPLIVHVGDQEAKRYAERQPLRRALMRIMQGRAQTVVTELPHPRPEILPLQPRPEGALAEYEASWQAHLAALKTLFDHA